MYTKFKYRTKAKISLKINSLSNYNDSTKKKELLTMSE